MTDWPPIIALIITYRRLPLAIETIRGVKEKVDYPNIGFHIADDGSGRAYVNKLLEEIGPSYATSYTDGARGGVGNNMNAGIAKALERADLWLHLEDDWVLPRPYDLRPAVKLLTEQEDLGMVKLGRLTAGMRAYTISASGYIWWRLVKGSDTYIFSGNPSLRHRRFHDAYGIYTKGLRPGETELSYCANFIHKEGPDIVWPSNLAEPSAFQHIGDHQSFKFHMETNGLSAEQAAEVFEGMG